VTHSVGDVYLLPLRPDYTPAGSPVRLTRENRAVGAPCWTADGRRLLYSVGGNLGYRQIQALQVDPSHADVPVEPVQLTQGDQATTVAIGRGGKRVARWPLTARRAFSPGTVNPKRVVLYLVAETARHHPSRAQLIATVNTSSMPEKSFRTSGGIVGTVPLALDPGQVNPAV